MNRTWLKHLAALLALLLVGISIAAAQNPVTFKVNMRVQALKGLFSIGADTIWVRGDFNNWAGLTDSMRMTRNSNADSIYNVTLRLAAGTVNYKFFYNHTGSGTWEGDPNRTSPVVAGPQTIGPVYFNRDSVYVATTVPVTFSVNMAVRWREGWFRPDSGDIVCVSGDFNGWANRTRDTLTKGAADSIYSKIILISQGSAITYKFDKTPRNNEDYEGGSNRTYTVPQAGGVIPTVFFSGDSVFRAPISGTVKWQVNMSAMKTLGWFDPAKDTAQVRGGFEGWGGTKMSQDLVNVNVYTKTLPFTGLTNDNLDFKFYMKLDSVHATSLWGTDWGTGTNRDGYNYEHPSTRGDGNNQYVLGSSGTLTQPIMYFSGINPLGLLTANDSVMVTFKVNMGPATRYTNPLVLASDTVRLAFDDRLWQASQKKSQNIATALPLTPITMTHTGATDTVYTATFKVKGPTHYSIMYHYRYNKTDGTSVDEGGGLGAQNPFRSRFIGKSGTVWPATYTAPTDTWKKDAPLGVEAAPFTTGIAGQPNGPLVYQLSQNYPNPFNPATTISYTLPRQSRVSLKVYDLLGQEVVSLVDGDEAVGSHVVVFDASHLASGVYFYRIEAGQFTQVRKMMLLK